MTPPPFAERMVRWQQAHGRHGLPWQVPPHSPGAGYRVWVSEIMLQQTQVAVVVPYFERWMAQFPDVTALANADSDAVMAAWAGLGYYARARNLHRAAQQVRDLHGGTMPTAQADLEALPGIGRSTAGAILALAFNQPSAILDGNVKRVLARHAAIPGWPGKGAVLKALWSAAEARTPSRDSAVYAQAMMDLGATVCTKAAPACLLCPVAADCSARLQGRQLDYPSPKPRKTKPSRHTLLLHAVDATGRTLLTKRPANGLWGGLWSLPEIDDAGALDHALRSLGLRAQGDAVAAPALQHELTHFRWHLQPVRVRVCASGVADGNAAQWWAAGDTPPALPAPVKRYLDNA